MNKYSLNNHKDMQSFADYLKDSITSYAESLILESSHTITCPKCGTKLDAFIGKDNECPNCHSIIQLELDSNR